MNERDMSLLKAVSEAVKEQLAAVHKSTKPPFRLSRIRLLNWRKN